MSEKRFVQSWNMHRGLHYLAIEDKKEKKIYCVEQSIGDVEKVADLLNEQEEEISYWKHRVSSLLMILSQFDNEKVKKLLEELDEREEI